ncbi:putative E3 ubiquitin-protein ligase LUL3 [Apostasia shenzhenica]|uniref:RING-type E3 ubiquitin transferase n=1 Tax=Apostasia shenzhenica TaxID=1088818 RepID=A0A2I0AZ91_9ASPA|nr:putative E3 ubiquitin-protein ligase LUL3 [Apostasia shenzhenica]
MGQSSSNSRRRQDYQQTHPPHTLPPPLPPPPPPPPNPYYSYPTPAAAPPPAAPYYYAYRPQQSGGYGGLMSFLDSLIGNNYPSSYRPNQVNVWWTSGAPPPPAPVPYHSPSPVSNSTVVAPPPYVEHQKAKKIKNDVNVHKDTIRMEVDEQNPDQFLVSFVYDAVVDGSITIYYFAKEGSNCTFSSIYDGFYKPKTIQFEKGTGKRFCQPSGHGIDLGFFELDDLSKTTSDVFPLVIYAEASQPTVISDQADKSTSTRAQISLAVIEKSSNGDFQAKTIKQILWIDGERYELQEIFGLENSLKEQVTGVADGDDMGKECVICMTEPRSTAVFPCRHLCMCSNCAKTFRLQSNKCPMCRQPVEKLMEISVENSEQ